MPRGLSKSSSAPVVCRAGFLALVSRAERKEQNDRRREQLLKQTGTAIASATPAAASVPLAKPSASHVQAPGFQSLPGVPGVAGRLSLPQDQSPRTKHAASFVRRLAGADEKGPQEWKLLLEHDVAQHRRAEQEKEREAAEKRRDVQRKQREQMDQRMKTEADAQLESQVAWRTFQDAEKERLKQLDGENQRRRHEAAQALAKARKEQVEEVRNRREAEAQQRKAEDLARLAAAQEAQRRKEAQEQKLKQDQLQAASKCLAEAEQQAAQRRLDKEASLRADQQMMRDFDEKLKQQELRRQRENDERLNKVKKAMALYEQSQGGSVADLMRAQEREDEARAHHFQRQQAAEHEAREHEKRRRKQELQRECVASMERQMEDKEMQRQRRREEDRKYMESARRGDFAVKVEEADKQRHKRQQAHLNAEVLKAQMKGREEAGEGRMSTPERKLNKTKLDSALGGLDDIFAQQRSVKFPEREIGLPGM